VKPGMDEVQADTSIPAIKRRTRLIFCVFIWTSHFRYGNMWIRFGYAGTTKGESGLFSSNRISVSDSPELFQEYHGGSSLSIRNVLANSSYGKERLLVTDGASKTCFLEENFEPSPKSPEHLGFPRGISIPSPRMRRQRTWNAKRETWNAKRGTRNVERETWNAKRGTRNDPGLARRIPPGGYSPAALRA